MGPRAQRGAPFRFNFQLSFFIFKWAEGRLFGEWIAGGGTEVPVEFGTEAEDEDRGEPEHGNHLVVPEEERAVEDAAEEVAAGDGPRAQRGDEAGVVGCAQANGEEDAVHQHFGEEEHEGRQRQETHSRQAEGEHIDEQEEAPVAVHGVEVVDVPLRRVHLVAAHEHLHAHVGESAWPAEFFEEMEQQHNVGRQK